MRRSIEVDLYPHIGGRPIAGRNPPELLAVLRKIEARGTHEARERVQQRASMIFRYAIATGRCERDPVVDLRGAFTSPTRYNYAALAQKGLAGVLREARGVRRRANDEVITRAQQGTDSAPPHQRS